MKQVLAIIPARGASKGIKNKNIRPFAGKPLLAHTIMGAKKSVRISRIIVSTESKKIAAIAKEQGAEVPFLRPKKLAQDKSSVVNAVIHLLNKLRRMEGYNPDFVVLLQPTSPLRMVEDIDRALDLLSSKGADSVVSVCRTEQLLFTKEINDELKLLSKKEFLKSGNRQELPPTYKLDGSMVYAIKTEILLSKRSFLAGKLVGYEIPRWRAIDVDEPQDFVVGEILYKNFKNIVGKLINFK